MINELCPTWHGCQFVHSRLIQHMNNYEQPLSSLAYHGTCAVHLHRLDSGPTIVFHVIFIQVIGLCRCEAACPCQQLTGRGPPFPSDGLLTIPVCHWHQTKPSHWLATASDGLHKRPVQANPVPPATLHCGFYILHQVDFNSHQ